MFYMYDVKKAETIKKVYESSRVDDVDSKDIEMAFNCYPYYVNCRNYEAPFDENWKRFDQCFIPKVEKRDFDASSRRKLAVACWFKIIKELFDPDYFEERLEYHKTHDDNECLFEYMHKLDVGQLKELLPILMGELFVFTWGTKELEIAWENLNKACLEVDDRAPVTNNIYDERGYFKHKMHMYFFDYLSKDKIVDIFCNSVPAKNRYNVAVLAIVMLTEGVEEVKMTLSRWWCDC